MVNIGTLVAEENNKNNNNNNNNNNNKIHHREKYKIQIAEKKQNQNYGNKKIIKLTSTY